MDIGLTDIFVITFMGMILLYFGISWPLQRQKKLVRERFEKYFTEKEKIEDEAAEITITRDQLSNIPLLNRFLGKMDASSAIRALLEQAGLTMNVGSLVLFMLFTGSLAFLFAMRMDNIMLSIIVTLGGSMLPIFFVVQKKKRRLKKFEKHFPDAVDLMTSALRAGLSFVGALKLVGQEAPDPINVEFLKTYEEQSLGVPLEECLDRLTKRIESIDLKFFITALLIQRDIGGNLTELLEKISYTIRERFKLIGQVKAQTSQGRFTGWMLSGMPFIMAGIISVLNPSYLQLLFTEKLGQYMVGGALGLQFLGFLVIKKVVNIKP